ncbi:PREDICTED: FAD-linked sulfhydryl oxidase ERV1 isoform X3 [Nicotiana attenuata]|uniref:FAD-linked sulfhydryl oxidase ERV1 isoform X3 n=1 Tax=Nicotiana attenuata TaxID=49451 RepID=UPI000904DDDE|nr:PREDICTED: FAD-linked sulfhydryl oxidase ERV1 isoform X3 [Nicotiana attenuata]
MSENPLQLLFKTYEKVSNSIQSQLAHFISVPKPPSSHNDDHSFSLGLSSSSSNNLPPSKSPTSQHSELPKQEKNAGPVTKEDLGRATWTFLHTLGAQYPDKPTRQQKRDVKELMAILSRMYPCKECADHFKEVLRHPMQWATFPGSRIWTVTCNAHLMEL